MNGEQITNNLLELDFEGEGKLPTLSVSFGRNNEVVALMIDRISYQYGPISAIILYRCNLAKYLNVLRNAFNVAPQSCCDSYSAEMVFQKRLWDVPTRTTNTYTTM